MAEPPALDRIALADLEDPQALAATIHRQLGPADGPVPVEDIARALDIHELRLTELDGCEGILLTDAARSFGAIAANRSHGLARARFTVAHELGHFLMERHLPHQGQRFVCRSADLRERKTHDRHQRQEAEANRFAIELLAPMKRVAPFLDGPPSIEQIRGLARSLDISREAAGRRYVQLHEPRLAAVWSRNGRIRYAVRGAGFPDLVPEAGDRLPQNSVSAKLRAERRADAVSMTETEPVGWVGHDDLALREAARIGRDGHTLTLLWALAPGVGDDR